MNAHLLFNIFPLCRHPVIPTQPTAARKETEIQLISSAIVRRFSAHTESHAVDWESCDRIRCLMAETNETTKKQVVFGHPELWTTVHDTCPRFFEVLPRLAASFNSLARKPHPGLELWDSSTATGVITKSPAICDRTFFNSDRELVPVRFDSSSTSHLFNML